MGVLEGEGVFEVEGEGGDGDGGGEGARSLPTIPFNPMGARDRAAIVWGIISIMMFGGERTVGFFPFYNGYGYLGLTR